MYKLKLVLILFLLTAPAQAGLPDVDVARILPDLIAQGFDKILISISDQMYSVMEFKNQSEATKHYLKVFVTPNDFLESKILQHSKDFNAFWYGVFYLGFLFIGGMIVMKEKAVPASGFIRESFGNRYLEWAIGGLLLFLFYLYGLDYIFKFETILSQGIVLQLMDIVPAVPFNAFIYFTFALSFFLMKTFFILRYLLLAIVSTYFLYLVCLSKIPVINTTIYIIFTYAVGLLFARPLLALVYVAGSGAIESLSIWGLGALGYLVLMLIMIFISFTLLVTPAIQIILRR